MKLLLLIVSPNVLGMVRATEIMAFVIVGQHGQVVLANVVNVQAVVVEMVYALQCII
jgi:hypothetical protein